MAISFHSRDGRSDFEKVARENCRRISHRLVELQIPLVSQQFNYLYVKKDSTTLKILYYFSVMNTFSPQTSKFLELKVNSIEGPTTVKLVNCKVDNLVTIGTRYLLYSYAS